MNERFRVVGGTSNDPGRRERGWRGSGEGVEGVGGTWCSEEAEEDKVRGIGEFRDLHAGRMSIGEEKPGQRLSF